MNVNFSLSNNGEPNYDVTFGTYRGVNPTSTTTVMIPKFNVISIIITTTGTDISGFNI
jgi:hypothetical protein